WASKGWNITRHRQLDNGGVNIAAVDPATGNGYALDSGFTASPNTIIVGMFNTECFDHSPGAAPFGSFAWPARSDGSLPMDITRAACRFDCRPVHHRLHR